jgi:hypothetical protein
VFSTVGWAESVAALCLWDFRELDWIKFVDVFRQIGGKA